MLGILIVEDEGLFRDMFKISLSSVPNMKVAEAVSDDEATNRLKPYVVLMDNELSSEPNGISAGRAIKEENEEIGMIVLSAHRERKYLNLIAKESTAAGPTC